MLDNTRAGASGGVVVTLGAAACMLSLLVLMGLKLRWFRARMTFDKPPKVEETPYAGVYRSNFADAFDYRRPSELPPISSYLSTSTSSEQPANRNTSYTSTSSEQVASTSQDKHKSLPSLATFTEVNEKKPKAANQVMEPKVKPIKEPKVVAAKEPNVKAVKEPKVKQPKEPKAVAVKEPKLKAVKEAKVKVPKEPKVKEPKEPKVVAVKEPKVKAVKEPKVKVVKEPKVKEVKPPKEKGSKKMKGAAVAINQNNAFPHVNPPSPPPMYDGTANNAVKTFSSMQPSGDVTPIPQRVIRNPVAMGAKVYKPPPMGMSLGDSMYDTIDDDADNDRRTKSWGAAQPYLYDMDEESET